MFTRRCCRESRAASAAPLGRRRNAPVADRRVERGRPPGHGTALPGSAMKLRAPAGARELGRPAHRERLAPTRRRVARASEAASVTRGILFARAADAVLPSVAVAGRFVGWLTSFLFVLCFEVSVLTLVPPVLGSPAATPAAGASPVASACKISDILAGSEWSSLSSSSVSSVLSSSSRSIQSALTRAIASRSRLAAARNALSASTAATTAGSAPAVVSPVEAAAGSVPKAFGCGGGHARAATRTRRSARARLERGDSAVAASFAARKLGDRGGRGMRVTSRAFASSARRAKRREATAAARDRRIPERSARRARRRARRSIGGAAPAAWRSLSSPSLSSSSAASALPVTVGAASALPVAVGAACAGAGAGALPAGLAARHSSQNHSPFGALLSLVCASSTSHSQPSHTSHVTISTG